MVYLIHFDKPYKHARHYVGYSKDNNLESRLATHRAGQGSRLLNVIQKAGIGWSVVTVWPEGDRNFERRLKKKAATRHCPICSQQPGFKRQNVVVPHYI